MAYKCVQSTYSGRFYKEGTQYESIGTADEKYFECLSPEPEPEQPDELAAVKEQLDALGVDYNRNLGIKKLSALLDEAQQAALTS